MNKEKLYDRLRIVAIIAFSLSLSWFTEHLWQALLQFGLFAAYLHIRHLGEMERIKRILRSWHNPN